MPKRRVIKTSIPVLYMKEGDAFICYCPALDLVAHGDSFEDAEKSFKVTLKLFIQEVTRKRGWAQVLSEYGWSKVDKAWVPPRIIGQESKSIEIPVAA